MSDLLIKQGRLDMAKAKLQRAAVLLRQAAWDMEEGGCWYYPESSGGFAVDSISNRVEIVIKNFPAAQD